MINLTENTMSNFVLEEKAKGREIAVKEAEKFVSLMKKSKLKYDDLSVIEANKSRFNSQTPGSIFSKYLFQIKTMSDAKWEILVYFGHDVKKSNTLVVRVEITNTDSRNRMKGHSEEKLKVVLDVKKPIDTKSLWNSVVKQVEKIIDRLEEHLK